MYNLSAIMSWFRNLPNKKKYKFFGFDIVDFNSLKFKKLLIDAIKFGKQYLSIDSGTLDIIFYCRKSFVFRKSSTGIKNNRTLFDVTMGSY